MFIFSLILKSWWMFGPGWDIYLILFLYEAKFTKFTYNKMCLYPVDELPPKWEKPPFLFA